MKNRTLWMDLNRKSKSNPPIVLNAFGVDFINVSPKFLSFLRNNQEGSLALESVLEKITESAPRFDGQVYFDAWIDKIFGDHKKVFGFLAEANDAEFTCFCLSTKTIAFDKISNYLKSIPKDDHAYKVVMAVNSKSKKLRTGLKRVGVESKSFSFLFLDKFHNCNAFSLTVHL